MSIEDITAIEESFFSIEQVQTENILFRDAGSYNVRLALFIQLDDTVNFIDRDVYNVFMLLGDVGGFSGLLYATSGVIVSYFSFYNAENYVVASLYQA